MNKAFYQAYTDKIEKGEATERETVFFLAGAWQQQYEDKTSKRKERRRNIIISACFIGLFLSFCLPQIWLKDAENIRLALSILGLLTAAFAIGFISKIVSSRVTTLISAILIGSILLTNGTISLKKASEIIETILTAH